MSTQTTIAFAPFFSAAPWDPDADALACNLDRDWFNSNPSRNHRIRSAIPGELLGVTDAGYMVVIRQMTTGLRIRLAFLPGRQLPVDDTEEFAATMFERLGKDMRGSKPDIGQLIPTASLRQEKHRAARRA
jgi:hypothetical protein